MLVVRRDFYNFRNIDYLRMDEEYIRSNRICVLEDRTLCGVREVHRFCMDDLTSLLWLRRKLAALGKPNSLEYIVNLAPFTPDKTLRQDLLNAFNDLAAEELLR